MWREMYIKYNLENIKGILHLVDLRENGGYY
jgi:hypothetical protein